VCVRMCVCVCMFVCVCMRIRLAPVTHVSTCVNTAKERDRSTRICGRRRRKSASRITFCVETFYFTDISVSRSVQCRSGDQRNTTFADPFGLSPKSGYQDSNSFVRASSPRYRHLEFDRSSANVSRKLNFSFAPKALTLVLPEESSTYFYRYREKEKENLSIRYRKNRNIKNL